MDQAALIDAIYEASVAPERWSRVLDGIAECCDAEGALLVVAMRIESWIAAYRERSLLNLGLAAYNTPAQVHNTMSAIDSLGPAFSSVGDMFTSALTSRGSLKDKAALIGLMIAIAVVVAALAAGAILTAVLIRRYSGTVPLRLPASPGHQPA